MNLRRSLSRGLALALLCSFAYAGLMATSGQFEVSPTGAATYTIPLSVPPGTAGIEPKLSLVYNSQAGNGLLGVGWSLSGLSAITRCPRTMAQDGVRGGINFDANDRFCLDGQRLMAVSGSYGADGTEYRTERESFSKVVSYGSAGSGPAWFKVWTKAGQILEYGNTADSRIEAQGKASARVWALNKLSDTKGNYFTVAYNKDNVNGDYVPSRIDYTGNAAIAPGNSVQFVYEGRPDVVPMYLSGSMIKGTRRLQSIQTYTDSSATSERRLSYQAEATTLRSRLTSTTDCSSTGNCLGANTFGWLDLSGILAADSNWDGRAATYHADQKGFKSVDMNGDGLADLAYEATNGVIRVLLSRGTSFAPDAAWGTRSASYNPEVMGHQLADLNGDALPDLLYEGSNGVLHVMLNTGTGFGADTDWGSRAAAYHSDLKGFRLADMNGDGLADLVYEATNGVIRVLLSRGTSFAPDAAWGTRPASYNPEVMGYQLADLNGDGLPDLLYEGSNGVLHVMLNTGTGFGADADWGSRAAAYHSDLKGFRLVDMNGDGLADLVYEATNGVIRVLLSRGTSFIPDAAWGTRASAYNGNAMGFRLADMNGDGLPDLAYDASDGQVRMMLNMGSGFGPDTAVGSRWSSYNPEVPGFQLADMNGDGGADPVYEASDGALHVLRTTSLVPGLLVSIISESQLASHVSYLPITRASAYAKDTGSSASHYPVADVQMPKYVVSAVSVSNGLGGTRTTAYKFGGLKVEIGSGRGLLGFRWTEATNPATGLTTRTEYRQDWPYVGLPSLVKKTTTSGGNAGLLSQTAHSYGCLNPQLGAACSVAAGNRYFPYVSQSVESGWDLSGAALPVVTTTNQFDSYGNATEVAVSTGDGYSKTTSNTYQNDTSNWFLGRLTGSQVQSVTP